MAQPSTPRCPASVVYTNELFEGRVVHMDQTDSHRFPPPKAACHRVVDVGVRKPRPEERRRKRAQRPLRHGPGTGGASVQGKVEANQGRPRLRAREL